MSAVSPRKISNELHSKSGDSADDVSSDNILTEKGVTHMTMQFGQFLDHDITTLTSQAGTKQIILNSYLIMV